jgi:hypothetical protein
MLKMSIKTSINSFFSEFGFDTISDFASSTFGFSVKPITLYMGISFGYLATKFERFIGLEPLVYLAFIALLFVEFYTGMRASIKEGVKIDSNKWQRVILKFLVYTIMIGILNIFKERLSVPVIMGSEINIYAWIYYTVLNLIVIQMIISVFENLTRLGFDETSLVFKTITKALKRWFDMGENHKTPKDDEEGN